MQHAKKPKITQPQANSIKFSACWAENLMLFEGRGRG
jgi:hypothetical protein